MIKMQSSVWLRRQQLWVLAVGALFFADFLLCGYWPSHTRLAGLKEKKIRYEQIILTGRSKGAQLDALRTRLSRAQEIAAHYDSYVPTEGLLGTFVRQMAELMTAHQLTDQAVVAGKETQAGELVCIPVHINGSGDLRGIFGFFNDVRRLDRLLRIDRTTLRNDNVFSGRLTMEADAVIYYRPVKEQTAAAPGGDKAVGGSTHGA
jgi:Tfp pilus assembly protein PilO